MEKDRPSFSTVNIPNIHDYTTSIRDKLWILLLASCRILPKSIDDEKYKERIYNHYRQISDCLLEDIINNWWFETLFWSKDFRDKLKFTPNIEKISEIFSWFFAHVRTNSIAYVKKFFSNNKSFLDPEFNTSRYEVWDRFERSVSNVHFVTLLYLYCYLIQYKNKYWNFPVLNDEKERILLRSMRLFALQMAKNLEMWLQMSFLRTVFWVPFEEWLSEKIRHWNIILPKDWWIKWVKLSPDDLYLVINNDLLEETTERVKIALKENQIPQVWNVHWCPAFPKLILWILDYFESDLKVILNNFKDDDIKTSI